MRAVNRSVRRQAARGRLALGVLLLMAAGSAGAQTIGEVPLSVSDSQGRAEIRLPDGAWRRAVIGRPVPAGSLATTWTDSMVVIEGAQTRVALAPFSHLEVTEDGDPLALVLEAGQMDIATAGEVSVVLAGGAVAVRGRGVELRVNSREIELISGDIEITRPDGSTQRLSRPGRYALGVHTPAPVFTEP